MPSSTPEPVDERDESLIPATLLNLANRFRSGTVDFEKIYEEHLLTRHMELASEFRQALGQADHSDPVTVETISNLLHTTKLAFESNKPDLLIIANTLDLVEHHMVRIYPPAMLMTCIALTRQRLERTAPPNWREWHERLSRSAAVARNLDDVDHDPTADDAEYRSILEKSISQCTAQEQRERETSALQISHLRSYRTWGFIILISLAALTPFITNSAAMVELEPKDITSPLVGKFFPVIVGGFLGAIGGYVSGLQQVQLSRAALSTHEEETVKLSLRPVVGGIMALLAYLFLSWGVITVIDAKNVGAFLLTCFLAGFSERYLLRILDVEKANGGTSPDKANPPAKPQGPADMQPR